jgi:hypothetical protein
MTEKLLTASQAAAKLKVSSVTVRVWCNRGLFPRAELKETEFGSGWLIPEGDLKNFTPPKMGRPPKLKEEAVKASRKSSKK